MAALVRPSLCQPSTASAESLAVNHSPLEGQKPKPPPCHSMAAGDEDAGGAPCAKAAWDKPGVAEVSAALVAAARGVAVLRAVLVGFICVLQMPDGMDHTVEKHCAGFERIVANPGRAGTNAPKRGMKRAARRKLNSGRSAYQRELRHILPDLHALIY